MAIAIVLVGTLLSCNPKKAPSKANATPPPISPMPIQGPITYLALGDSTGVGVGARNGGYVVRLFNHIVAERPGSRLINLCVSGATTADVLEAQLDRGLTNDPNLVTLGIGINDIGLGVGVDEFAQNYEKIISALRNGTKARIIVTNIPDISSAPRIPEFARVQYQQAIVAFNQRLETIAARYDVTVFDVYSTTREKLPTHPEFFSNDGFHPSDAGYELWAEEMWPVIQQAIGEN